MLGIIGAMAQEVQQLKNEMTEPEISVVAGMEFYKGKICGKDTVVVMCGIGKVNAGMCVQVLVDRYGVDGIVNTGVAGSLRAEINIGDLVLSTDAVQHDMDVTPLGYKVGQIPDLDTFAFTADERLRKLAKECCEKVNPDICCYEGRVVTGDQFISSAEKKAWLIETFAGSCAEMEGGAIAQAAYLNKVPFLIIRAISDKADNSAEMDYPSFERQAVVHSINLTRALIAAE